jgi:hypothetical protein
MRKFKIDFQNHAPAKPANPANNQENQKLSSANPLLKSAKKSEEPAKKFSFSKKLADFSKPLANNISNENKDFSIISNISRGTSGNYEKIKSDSGLKIEPMNKCLHGKNCRHLMAPGGDVRPTCKKNGLPVFDMNQCPAGLWASGLTVSNVKFIRENYYGKNTNRKTLPRLRRKLPKAGAAASNY